MDEIKFRSLRFSDILPLCKMLTDIWKLGRCPQMSKLGKAFAGLLYALSILEETEKTLVAVTKKPVGFCGYGIGEEKKVYIWLRKSILALLPSKDKALYQRYYKLSSYGELHASKQNAEITILIISPQFYGKGLGKELIEQIQKDASARGCQSIFALTDSGCHWHFYEKQGYQKVLEQGACFINPSEIDEIQYVFQKKL